MLTQDKENTLIELFIAIDDFCMALDQWKQARYPTPTRTPDLSDSELMSICVFYHYSGYKCFQYYYQQMVEPVLSAYFPRLVRYERFLSLLLRILPGLYVFLKYCTLQSQQSGFYFIDSKKLVVCDNRRIHSHRVFEGIAGRGKSSTGWFFGLKLHLVINHMGQIMNFLLTSGNVADNNHEVLQTLLKELKGECYGDKGYLSTLFEVFYRQGLLLVTKVKANMKNQLIKLQQAYKLRKRALIESVNDILTSVFDLEQSRHRNPYNALAHILSGLIAYCFYPNKPAVYMPQTDKLLIA